MFSLFSNNKIEMNYHAQEMDLSTKGNFTSFTEETWIIGDKYIKTPHGVLQIKNAIFVEQGALVGIQFTVKGSINLSSFSCSKGNEGKVNIKTFAVMRQPNNAWLWCYAFAYCKFDTCFFSLFCSCSYTLRQHNIRLAI